MLLLAAASASAAISTFGSPLSVAATLNTSENLNYEGTNTNVPVGPEAPDGVFHTYHFGADTALWNTALNGGIPTAPATGQAVKVMLEGCAQSAPGGPRPLTQIHFQDITPLPGGGAKVNVTSQPFEIPICGANGASGSTITTYEPENLCVSQGDYVDFNDEGGYVENVYRNGVPYQVIGSAPGSTMDSFIKGGGTNNGSAMSPSERSAMEGFATNDNEELMLQVELGTGADANHNCGGGTGGLPPPPPALAPFRISPQTDGINAHHVVAVAFYCRPTTGCKGTATVTYQHKVLGHTSFSVHGDATSHVPIRLVAKSIALIRKHHGISTVLSAVVDGQPYTQKLVVKIF
jgi:hypothetical protein